jgi:hypothetical protein
MNFRFPQFVPTPLAQIIPNASHEAIVMMTVICWHHVLHVSALTNGMDICTGFAEI